MDKARHHYLQLNLLLPFLGLLYGHVAGYRYGGWVQLSQEAALLCPSTVALI